MFKFKRLQKIAYLFRADERDPAEVKLRQAAGSFENRCQEIEQQWQQWHEKIQQQIAREPVVFVPRNLQYRIMQNVHVPILNRLLQPAWCTAYALLLAVLWCGWFGLEITDMRRIQDLEIRMVSQQPLHKPLPFQVMQQIESLPRAAMQKIPVLEQKIKWQTCLRNNFKTRALLYGALNNNPQARLQLLALCGDIEMEMADVMRSLNRNQVGSGKPFFGRMQ